MPIMATHSGKDKSIHQSGTKKRLSSTVKNGGSAQKKAKRTRVRKTWACRWVKQSLY